MVQAVIDLGELQNTIVNIVKAKYGFKNKSQAVNKLIEDNFDQYFELRPDFLKKLKKIDKEPGIPFSSMKELRELIEKA
ncbi:DUF2683 family protein [Candidatus Woesearchaeota archaeon]|nr:DUF2683 family protein [Candidatus Woesearchaeota archaeon]